MESGLKVSTQSRYYAVTGIFGPHKFITDLIQEKFVRRKQLKVCFGFKTAFSVGVISDYVCKCISIRIRTLFCSVFGNIGLSKYFAVGGQNTATDDPVRKSILTCVVRAIDKIITLYGIEINKITDQSHKNSHEKYRHTGVASISGTASFRSGAFFQFPLSL